MRGKDEQQLDVFSYVCPEKRVPQDHPLRSLQTMTGDVLQQLKPQFNKLYGKNGRPSRAPEKLLHSMRSFTSMRLVQSSLWSAQRLGKREKYQRRILQHCRSRGGNAMVGSAHHDAVIRVT
jgi:hypothetical protein